MIRVYCSHCNEWIGEQKVEVTGIEEDFSGRDVLYFTCPKCKTEQKSLRIKR